MQCEGFTNRMLFLVLYRRLTISCQNEIHLVVRIGRFLTLRHSQTALNELAYFVFLTSLELIKMLVLDCSCFHYS